MEYDHTQQKIQQTKKGSPPPKKSNIANTSNQIMEFSDARHKHTKVHHHVPNKSTFSWYIFFHQRVFENILSNSTPQMIILYQQRSDHITQSNNCVAQVIYAQSIFSFKYVQVSYIKQQKKWKYIVKK
ncbi:hypothetical protein RFI_15802 [Reticulomyxa filosa]|uniref:Uncharacterized protein n=1 Tax=Reticulomyxa filosa TaxID=46433 RepID=X6N7Y6_RETFI|nr:hypothetical protein RFI_15802 [Reticulomyxa filosa]|eukprot:ETO21402.1 hypothetical protein RFI_15802 [Reticulomyxa filosa]